MNRMSQWLAIAFSTWYTWLIYVSNSPAGTESQVDLVPWITWGLFAISLNSVRMDDEFLIQLQHKTHWIKAGADINIIAQVFLLVVTGHWLLALVRGPHSHHASAPLNRNQPKSATAAWRPIVARCPR